MTDVVTAEDVAREISDLLRVIAGPVRDGESVPQQMARVGRALRRADISDARLWSLWYRPRDVVVRAHEADTIRACAKKALARRQHLEKLEAENAELRRMLAAQDQELDAGRRARHAVRGRCRGIGGMALAGPRREA